MAKPRVFVSSTYYDLKYVRSSLEVFINSLGYDPVLSEKGDIAYTPDLPLDESCYREAQNSDIYVLMIGGRYGSEVSQTRKPSGRDFFERYESITKQEYSSAVSKDIPIYILIEKGVHAEYQTFLKNRDNKEINYAHVDSVNIFTFIEEILAQPRNNPVHTFERYSDIEGWLRDQWAGVFRELIQRRSDQQQLASLSAQVSELAEINRTLKRYLEELLVSEDPAKSRELISTEDKRLEDTRTLAQLKKNRLVSYLVNAHQLDEKAVLRALLDAKTFAEFKQKLTEYSGKDVGTILSGVVEHPATEDFKLARESLGIMAPSRKTKARKLVGKKPRTTPAGKKRKP